MTVGQQAGLISLFGKQYTVVPPRFHGEDFFWDGRQLIND
jgi:hypothetical protein